MANSESVKNVGGKSLYQAPYGKSDIISGFNEVKINVNQTSTEQADLLADFLLNRTDKFQDIADFLSALTLNIVKGLSNRSKKLLLESETINVVIENMAKQKIKV